MFSTNHEEFDYCDIQRESRVRGVVDLALCMFMDCKINDDPPHAQKFPQFPRHFILEGNPQPQVFLGH
jgi:hypothetical protein